MFILGMILVISLLLPGHSLARTIDDYLLEASDNAYTNVLEKGGNLGQDWIKSTEFRVQREQRHNGEDSETYRLRVRPKYGRERSAELSSNKYIMQRTALQTETLLSNNLRQQYMNVIGLLELFFNTNLLEDKKILLQAELNAERSLHKSSTFDPEKIQGLIIDLDRTVVQLKLSQERFKGKINNLQLNIDDNGVDFGDQFISPEFIQSVLHERKSFLDNSQAIPAVQMAELEKNIAEMRLQIQQSKNRFGVDFVDLKYTDTNDNATALTFSFRLPIGRDTGTLARRHDKNMADSEYRQVSDTATTMVHEQFSEITWKYMAWQADRQALGEIKQLMAQPQRAQNSALITGLRRQQLSLNRNMNTTHIRILKEYVALLDVTGILGQYPLRNWLSSGAPVLEPPQL